MATSAVFREPYGIDFDSSHRVINALVDVLQGSFKEETHYARPLMSPQANILFALDRDSANSMINYMSSKLQEVGGFAAEEFRFTCRSSSDGAGLQRLRLEFTKGVTSEIIRKMIIATDELEKKLPHSDQK